MHHGACRGQPVSLFFPRGRRSLDEVLAVCASCPVMGDCRDYGLSDPELIGIWGGTTATQRADLRRHAS